MGIMGKYITPLRSDLGFQKEANVHNTRHMLAKVFRGSSFAMSSRKVRICQIQESQIQHADQRP